MTDYKIYLSGEGPRGRPEEQKEIELDVVNAETLEQSRVRAVLFGSAEPCPGTDRLWLYSKGGLTLLEEKPWAMKIVEIKEEEVPEVKALPKQKISLGQMRGHMLETLIRQRDKKE